MLLDNDEKSPLKAIDFGLAVFFDPDKLPRTDLGLEVGRRRGGGWSPARPCWSRPRPPQSHLPT